MPSKRRLLDSPHITTSKSTRRRVEVTGRIRKLVSGATGGDDAGGSCQRWTPSKRRLDSPHITTSKRKRRDAGAERPVEVIGRVRNLAVHGGASALEVGNDGTSVRVRHCTGGGGSCRDFTLDGVSLSGEEGLEGFYRRFVRSRVQGVCSGAKCTVMLYGPTGSGKSHTMFGSAEQPGVVYLALRDILEGRHGGGGGGGGEDDAGEFVQVSVVEIYNEKAYDLLAGSGGADATGNAFKFKPKVKLQIVGTKARNATCIYGNEAGKISMEVAKVEKRRTVKSTPCNERSSRSHCLIILDVPSVRGRLMLVDMAGSENIEAAGQTGFEAKMQTAKINQGNTALKRVVESIANGGSHVPFRDSKLTMLLQDSFEDDKSKILMILCASPDPKELHKTVSTLEYGAKAKCIIRAAHASTPRYKMNSEDSRIAAMEQFIYKLEKENEEREKERDEALRVKKEELAQARAKLRLIEGQSARQQQELLALKQRLQEVESEKVDARQQVQQDVIGGILLEGGDQPTRKRARKRWNILEDNRQQGQICEGAEEEVCKEVVEEGSYNVDRTEQPLAEPDRTSPIQNIFMLCGIGNNRELFKKHNIESPGKLQVLGDGNKQLGQQLLEDENYQPAKQSFGDENPSAWASIETPMSDVKVADSPVSSQLSPTVCRLVRDADLIGRDELKSCTTPDVSDQSKHKEREGNFSHFEEASNKRQQQHQFSFLLGDLSGAPVWREEESTVQISSLPDWNNQTNIYLAYLRALNLKKPA